MFDCILSINASLMICKHSVRCLMIDSFKCCEVTFSCVLFFLKKPQNFLKRNIVTASQQTVKKQKSKLEVERAKERREKLATDHKRGVVPE